MGAQQKLKLIVALHLHFQLLNETSRYQPALGIAAGAGFHRVSNADLKPYIIAKPFIFKADCVSGQDGCPGLRADYSVCRSLSTPSLKLPKFRHGHCGAVGIDAGVGFNDTDN